MYFNIPQSFENIKLNIKLYIVTIINMMNSFFEDFEIENWFCKNSITTY